MKYAIENGMIDMTYIREQIEMNKRKELLERHPYKIWEGKDGKWYTYLPDVKKGRRLVKRNSQKSIEDIVIAQIKEDETNPTIADVFEEWNNRRMELGKIAKSTYDRDNRFFRRHFSTFGEHKMKLITEEDIVDFLERQIAEHNLSAKGYAGLTGITRGLLKYAKRKGYIDLKISETLSDMDMTDSSFKRTKKKDSGEVFSESETEKIISYLKNNLDIQNLGLLLLFVTGMRVGELASLKHSDIGAYTITIQRTETYYKGEDGRNVYEVAQTPKTEAGERDVVIPDGYAWLLRKLQITNPFEEYIFVKNGKRMTTNCFRARLYRVCEKLGIPKRSPHKIRKTYASILLDGNTDRKFIERQLGHTDISCTEQFYHRDRRTIEEKREIINGIPEFKSAF